MSKAAHTQKHKGETITARFNGIDYEIYINEKHFGAYLSLDSGVDAAKAEIDRRQKR